MQVFAIVCAVLIAVPSATAYGATLYNGMYHSKTMARWCNQVAIWTLPIPIIVTWVYYVTRGINAEVVPLAALSAVAGYHILKEWSRARGRAGEQIPDEDGISGPAHSRLFWIMLSGAFTIAVMLLLNSRS
jgi:hypothetical protein